MPYPLEEIKNDLSRVKSGVGVRAVGTDASPDGHRTGNHLSTTILSLLLPTKADQVDGCVLDMFTVDSLTALEQMSVCRLLHFKKVTNLITNRCP